MISEEEINRTYALLENVDVIYNSIYSIARPSHIGNSFKNEVAEPLREYLRELYEEGYGKEACELLYMDIDLLYTDYTLKVYQKCTSVKTFVPLLNSIGWSELVVIGTGKPLDLQGDLDKWKVISMGLAGVPLNGVSKIKGLEAITIEGDRLKKDIVERIPDKIGQMKNLKRITIKSSNIKTVPESLFESPCLTEVELTNNKITEIPEIIPSSKVETINMSGNYIRKIPPSLFETKNLVSIDLSNNEITELPDISNSTNMYLNLANNKITEIPDISNTVNMELNLANNEITELPDISNSTNTYLNLANNEITEIPKKMLKEAIEMNDTIEDNKNVKLNLYYNQIRGMPEYGKDKYQTMDEIKKWIKKTHQRTGRVTKHEV